MFLPHSESGAGLTNLEYAPLCEVMGRVALVRRSVQLLRAGHRQHGNPRPLRLAREQGALARSRCSNGEIRSAFCMTEPAVASSDATNIETSIRRDGDHYVINGRKWWSSGAGDTRCKVLIVMGKTDPTAREARAAVADRSCRWTRRA